MRVRMLSGRGGYACGTVCEVPDALALAWCSDLTCERVPEPAPVPVVETAMAEPAPVQRPKGRGRRVETR